MAEMSGNIGTVTVSVEVDLKGSEQFDAIAKMLGYVKKLATQNVTDAWNDWGVNVFNDDSLDDFDRFEKVYQICQEIVEPIERTCTFVPFVDEDGSVVVSNCSACDCAALARCEYNYCPNCGCKVDKSIVTDESSGEVIYRDGEKVVG